MESNIWKWIFSVFRGEIRKLGEESGFRKERFICVSLSKGTVFRSAVMAAFIE